MPIGRKNQMTESRKNFTLRLSETERKRREMDAQSNRMNPTDYLRQLYYEYDRVYGASQREKVINEKREK